MALTLTLILTGFACAYIAMSIPKKNSEMATALLIAFFITFYSAWIGLLLGLVLCLLVDGYEKDSQAAWTDLALEIQALEKEYASGVKALKGINLSVTKGDFFALLGPNGAGKSSTIGIISSLVTKTSGTVKIFGIDIDRDFNEAKRQIGVVAQEINFSPFEKVRDIVLTQAGYYGLSKREAILRGDKVLKSLGLWDKRDEQSRNLSGGLKRRLMIAKAMIQEPKLLILDEPTAGVDIELRRGMWDLISKLNDDGTTIILTTHYLEEAEQLCRNIAIIDHGEIVENTSMKELLAKLDVQSFVIDLEHPIESAPELSHFTFKLQDPSLIVAIDKQQTMNNLFTELNKLNISVKSMRNESNRLEELFMNVIKDEKKGNFLESLYAY